LGLKPVMTFTAPVIAIYDFPAGSEIGYGSTYRCEKDTRVAVVAVGYGDGYPRHAQTGTPVYLNGQRCRLLGRVSMDMITVELPKGLEVEVGDEAELWGDNLAVNEVAAHATTISYELLSSVAPRLARLV
jgi:alanine racemase